MPRTRLILIEDSFTDVSIFSRALKHHSFQGEFHTYETAEDFLEAYSNLDLAFSEKVALLVDINLPGMSGLDLLSELYFKKAFMTIPKICMTSSNDPKDISNAYQKGANSYLIKPTHFEDYLELTCLLLTYWLRYNISLYQESPSNRPSLQEFSA